jgi:DNA-binding GntR family transcriptional regulator
MTKKADAEVLLNPSGLPGQQPIHRQTLHGQVANRVRDMIIEGILAPGSRIYEGELGAQLGVSRTPLREALKTLAGEGLIDLVPSRGAVVRKLTAQAAADMLEVLAELEAAAGRKACERASAEEIAAVRQLHDRMIVLYTKRKRLEYYKLNQEIHSSIARLSKNEELRQIHELLQARLKRIRFIGNEGPDRWAGAVSDHEEIIAALEARDADRLARALRVHMEATWMRVRDAI